jgi:hypothetical protein
MTNQEFQKKMLSGMEGIKKAIIKQSVKKHPLSTLFGSEMVRLGELMNSNNLLVHRLKERSGTALVETYARDIGLNYSHLVTIIEDVERLNSELKELVANA